MVKIKNYMLLDDIILKMLFGENLKIYGTDEEYKENEKVEGNVLLLNIDLDYYNDRIDIGNQLREVFYYNNFKNYYYLIESSDKK